MTAAWLIFSGSISASISCWSRIGRASRTVIRRVCDCLGMIFSNMFWRSISICSKLPAPRIETGATLRPGMVISTSRSSSSPASSRVFIFSRDRWRRSAASSAWGESASLQFVGWGGGKSRSSSRCSTRASACSSTVSRSAVAHQDDRRLDQVADQALDVAAEVADLGVLGRLGLDERRADQHGQPAGDLGLADAGRADQHDVLGRDLGAQLVGKLPPPPAVAQGDRDGPLGVGLADDVAVQLGDDLPGRQLGLVLRHGSSSTLGLPSLKHAYGTIDGDREPQFS